MSRDIGIDLGTANVLIHLKGRGIIFNEPAVVAVDARSQEVISVGREAYEMRGRTPESIEVVQPLKGGVISDYDLTEAMLVLFFKRLNIHRGLRRLNVLISTPTNISEIEQLSLYEAVQKVSSGRVFIEPEPLVAAVGSGLDVLGPAGSMVVDIGGGTTDIAIMANGEILFADSIKIAGDDFDESIVQYFKDHYQLLIGIQSAEKVKKAVASAIKQDPAQAKNTEVKGRDLVTGLPKAINVNSNDLHDALDEQINQISRAIRRVLEQAPPEITADVYDRGIVLTGGGALIQDLDQMLSEYLKVTVVPADQPMSAVAIGTGIMLEWITSGKLDRTPPSKKQKRRRFWTKFWRRIWGS
ncbi:rod shape-determining protein [Facklamia sp. DSM 111018]|uniref:Cell shape-determining protein MreB n=1 Tax=Facklamia lactis TaxID=2749967 RepID=A0ABS0LNI6_9LACT|nr:rod shape-determining protein [Facklamia lactis]MBG9979633.1 rod shape-determining protein [Facklamia lactis]MBG9985687.1 rod shape-determining protein [Facklamia lactis]